MSTLRIGIASPAQMKARSLAIARGELKPEADDPQIWFPSSESMARVLSEKNRALLRTIAQMQPESLSDLAEATGRAASNLSRTLRTMERYGLVRMQKGPQGAIRPEVPYTDVSLTLSLQ